MWGFLFPAKFLMENKLLAGNRNDKKITIYKNKSYFNGQGKEKPVYYQEKFSFF